MMRAVRGNSTGILPAISKIAHCNDMTKEELKMNLIDTLMHVSHSFGIKKVKGNSYGVSEQPESYCALHHDLLGGGR
jgi:hypothetical protein